jgi:hypothetical protein
LLSFLAGCVSLPQSEALRCEGGAGLPPRVELGNVLFFAQEEYQCGPGALAMALNAAGAAVTPEGLRPTSSDAGALVRTGFQEQLEPDIRPG